MIKLIASDMDGTLLPSFGVPVDPEVYDIIKKLKEHGVIFIAASGRQYANLQKEFEPVKEEINYLCENGCLLIHDGEVLIHETMPTETAKGLVQKILDTPGYTPLVSGVHTSYIVPNDPDFYNHIRYEVGNEVTKTDHLLDIGEPYFKISAYNKVHETALNEMPKWQSDYEGELTCVYGGNGYVDFSPLGVSKGITLTKYMNYLGFQKDEVMVFGDNYNDETMLRSVKYSFAMENAPDDIKAFCYGTTDSVKNTLKEYFKDLL